MEDRRIDSLESMVQSGERDLRMTTLIQRPSPASGHEWLGPESHVPNLGRALREQNKPARNSAGAWILGAFFIVGLAMGSLATVLITQSRRRL